VLKSCTGRVSTGHGQIESETSEYATIQKDDGKCVLIPQEDIVVKRLP
jgi:hypothetical protein